MNCETEVSYLSLAVLDKAIGQFDISVDNIFRIKVFESFIHIFDVGVDLVFTQCSFLLEFFLQSSIFTKLTDKVAMINAFENLVATDGVLVVQQSRDHYFLFK